MPARRAFTSDTPERLAEALVPDYPVEAGYLDWYEATEDYIVASGALLDHELVCRVSELAGVSLADWFREALQRGLVHLNPRYGDSIPEDKE